MKLIVTGGAGFIGSAVVRRAVADGHHVINLDVLSYSANLANVAEAAGSDLYVFEQADICDQATVAAIFERHQPDAIMHLAAESHNDRAIDGPLDFVRSNVMGTAVLLEVARAYWSALPADRKAAFRFHHVSTDEVFGALGEDGAFTEDTPYDPNSPYSASKAASDHFVRAYHHTYGLPTLTTNCSNNYGPCQFPEKLIPLMILNCLSGKPLPVYGDGGQIRDWLYVGDHCQAIRTVLRGGRIGEVYNIGGACERTNLEVVHEICRMVDRLRPDLPHAPCESLVTSVKDRPGHDRRYAIDFSKIERELGWRPTETFATGLEKTVAWYLANGEWVDRIASGGYRQERLGLATNATGSHAA